MFHKRVTARSPTLRPSSGLTLGSFLRFSDLNRMFIFESVHFEFHLPLLFASKMAPSLASS